MPRIRFRSSTARGAAVLWRRVRVRLLQQAGTAGAAAADVTIMTVHPERVAETEEFAGEVTPVRRVEVRSPVAGVIVARADR